MPPLSFVTLNVFVLNWLRTLQLKPNLVLREFVSKTLFLGRGGWLDLPCPKRKNQSGTGLRHSKVGRVAWPGTLIAPSRAFEYWVMRARKPDLRSTKMTFAVSQLNEVRCSTRITSEARPEGRSPTYALPVGVSHRIESPEDSLTFPSERQASENRKRCYAIRARFRNNFGDRIEVGLKTQIKWLVLKGFVTA